MSASEPMTMPPAFHPDDERLAAFAAAEPDVLADAPLAAHVGSCSRCGPIVADLRAIHIALSELPDLPPSRPLHFLPTVPEPPRTASGWTGLLRRLATPVMGIAAVLILVGAVGSSGVFHLPGAASADLAVPAAAPGEQRSAAGASDGKQAPGGAGAYVGGSPASLTPTARPADSSSGSPQFRPVGGPSTQPTAAGTPPLASRIGLSTGSEPPYPWIRGAGVLLLAAGFVTRAATGRREGDD